MTGGGSLLYGLDKLISEKTHINTVIADDAVSCVALGTGKYIEFEEGSRGYNRKRKRPKPADTEQKAQEPKQVKALPEKNKERTKKKKRFFFF